MTTPKTPEEEGLVKEPEKEAGEVDVFDEAFDAALSALPKDVSDADDPAKQKDEPAKEPEPDAEKAEPDAEKEPDKQPEKQPDAEPEKKTEKEPDESAEAYKQRWLTSQGIHKADREKWEQERAEFQAKLEAAQKSPDPPKKEEPAKEPEPFDLRKILDTILTAEQKAELKEYEQEFDLVSKMEGLKYEAAFKKLYTDFAAWKDELQKSVLAQIDEKVKPTETFVAETQQAREEAEKVFHFDSIRQAHPDFEKYRDEGAILKWIESKPAYLKAGMKEAYEHGTTADVIALIADFKTENNITTPGAQPDNVEDIEKKRQEIEAERAKKKKALESPVSRRGAVNPSHAQADDYESAFDEALHK